MVTKTDSEDVATRRAQLRRWIKTKYANQAAFVAATKVNQGELSALLKDKSFGEKRARSLEKIAGMPPKYLDQRDSAPIATDGGYALNTAMRTGHVAEDLAGRSAWPFQHVTPEQYAKLSVEERSTVERIVALLLSAHGVRSRVVSQLVHGT